MKKVLFVTSEAHPLIKTGGLADVSGSLPKALTELSQDIRLIIPHYQSLKLAKPPRLLATVKVDNYPVDILEYRLSDTDIIVWLVDYPEFFGYPGNPYTDETGQPWPNNSQRFALFCRIAVEIAMNRAGLNWQPEIVHCNDWQSGLVPAYLSLEKRHPKTVFTIHNMAYQGLFPASDAISLNIPGNLWNADGLEFYNLLSFMKGGLVYADHITTVSPTYALEIQTPEFGYGLAGLLAFRKKQLTGILNGIDMEQWNPATDALISQPYDATTLEQKSVNKSTLQQRIGLPVIDEVPLFGLISRLVEQKGINLILDSLPELLQMPIQFVLLGAGDNLIEQRLRHSADVHPDKIAVTIGYDESLAHLIEAGSDSFLMPSLFEPCGLNQMYSQRYGTVPIVRKTGGLADTVVDSLPHTLANKTATGIVFKGATSGSLLEAIKRALLLYNNPVAWKKMQINGMGKDFSWQGSAEHYLDLYDKLLEGAQ